MKKPTTTQLDEERFDWTTLWMREDGEREPWIALVEHNGDVVLEIARGPGEELFGEASAWPVAWAFGSAPDAEIVAELPPGTLFFAVDSTEGIPVDRLRMHTAGEPWLGPIEHATLSSQGIDVLRLSQPVATLPESTACPADLNADRVVDGADLGLLLGAWGSCL